MLDLEKTSADHNNLINLLWRYDQLKDKYKDKDKDKDNDKDKDKEQA